MPGNIRPNFLITKDSRYYWRNRTRRLLESDAYRRAHLEQNNAATQKIRARIRKALGVNVTSILLQWMWKASND